MSELSATERSTARRGPGRPDGSTYPDGWPATSEPMEWLKILDPDPVEWQWLEMLDPDPMEWLEMLDLELAAKTRRIEAEARFALWTRLVALEAARGLQQDEAAR